VIAVLSPKILVVSEFGHFHQSAKGFLLSTQLGFDVAIIEDNNATTTRLIRVAYTPILHSSDFSYNFRASALDDLST